MDVVGEVDYKIQTYHINMLKWYFYGEGVAPPQDNRSQPTQVGEVVNSDSDGMSIDQAAAIACVIEDEEIGDDTAVKDEDTLPLYNFKQKETVKDVVVNPELNAAQQKRGTRVAE